MAKRLKEMDLGLSGETYKDIRLKVLDALNLINKSGDTVLAARIIYKTNPIARAKIAQKKQSRSRMAETPPGVRVDDTIGA
jgi:hypothetical protein